MKQAPTAWPVMHLVNTANNNQKDFGGMWFPARPLSCGGLRKRLIIAWRVFTGRYDAIEWPQGQ